MLLSSWTIARLQLVFKKRLNSCPTARSSARPLARMSKVTHTQGQSLRCSSALLRSHHKLTITNQLWDTQQCNRKSSHLTSIRKWEKHPQIEPNQIRSTLNFHSVLLATVRFSAVWFHWYSMTLAADQLLLLPPYRPDMPRLYGYADFGGGPSWKCILKLSQLSSCFLSSIV